MGFRRYFGDKWDDFLEDNIMIGGYKIVRGILYGMLLIIFTVTVFYGRMFTLFGSQALAMLFIFVVVMFGFLGLAIDVRDFSRAWERSKGETFSRSVISSLDSFKTGGNDERKKFL